MKTKKSSLNNYSSSIIELLNLIKPYKSLFISALVFLNIAAITLLLIGGGLRFVIDILLSNKINLSIIKLTTFGLLLGSILISISSFGRFVCVSIIEEKVGIYLKNKLFKKIIELEFIKIKKISNGELITIFQDNITQIKKSIGRGLSIGLRSIIQLFGSLILLFFTSPMLFVCVIIITVLILLPVYTIGNKLQKKVLFQQKLHSQILSFIEESWSQIKTIKLWGQEIKHSNFLKKKFNNLMILEINKIINKALLNTSIIFLVSAGLSLLFWIGGESVLNNSISSGSLASFVFYSIIAAGSINSINGILNTISQSVISLNKIKRILNTHNEVFNTKKSIIKKLIKIKSISFHYPNQKETIIKNISTTLYEKSLVALIGPSGSGKSTLIQLILKTLVPNNGSINTQKNNLDYHLKNWWSEISYVPQQPDLFNISIMDNIKYSNPKANINDIYNSAKKAHAHSFIQKLPQKYNTIVGNKGDKLSLGQKQRIYLARAFLRNPKLLILDEPTSALDLESERYVMKSILNYKQKSIILIATHRTSTIKEADKILILNNTVKNNKNG